MAEKFIPPRGRQTIRKGGSLTGANGPVSRPMKLWEFEPKPNTTLAKLEAAYMAGVEAVDRVEERARGPTPLTGNSGHSANYFVRTRHRRGQP